MRFDQNFTLLDFQANIFTPLNSPNFNSCSDKNTKKSQAKILAGNYLGNHSVQVYKTCIIACLLL